MKILMLTILVVTVIGCQKMENYFGEARKIRANKSGEADLMRATHSKKINIETAKAKLESAKLEARAEVERARGVAEANKIIGDSLKGNQAYLRYLWITNMNNEKEVIYIPTEAGMPILEAGKRR